MLPWGRSQPSPLPGAAALPGLSSPLAPTCPSSSVPAGDGEASSASLSPNILTEEEPRLSYPTLPKGGPMLSTLPSFPNPLTHQLVED